MRFSGEREDERKARGERRARLVLAPLARETCSTLASCSASRSPEKHTKSTPVLSAGYSKCERLDSPFSK